MPRPSLGRILLGSGNLVAGAVLLMVGGIFLVIVTSLYLDDQRYRTAGRTVEATVVGKQLRRATENTGTAYELTYRLRLDDGRELVRTEATDIPLWERLEEGDAIHVEHVPGDDGSSRIDRQANPVMLVIGLGVGSLLAFPGAWLVLGGLGAVRRKLRLYRTGTPATATVVDVRESNVRVNKVTWWVVAFTYRDGLGRTVEAVSDPMPPREAEGWSPGDTAQVRVDLHSGECAWLGR